MPTSSHRYNSTETNWLENGLLTTCLGKVKMKMSQEKAITPQNDKNDKKPKKLGEEDPYNYSNSTKIEHYNEVSI